MANHTDDVRVFAGCVTGRKDWPTRPAARVPGVMLADAVSHWELAVVKVTEDPTAAALFVQSRARGEPPAVGGLQSRASGGAGMRRAGHPP